MAASGRGCSKPLVGTRWAISSLLCTNGLRKPSSGHVRHPFLAVKFFFSVCTSGHCLRAMTIESLLTSGSG